MENRAVGATDMEISVIGLGGAWLGHHPDDPADAEAALAVLRAVDECGINWLDTSENYFDTKNEAVIGQALRSMPDEFLVCSKVAPGAVNSGGASGFRPEQVRSACEASLQRLGRERLDVYLLHWPDDTGVPLTDTWGAMAELVDAGKVRAIGLSNYDQGDIDRCHQQRPVDVLQTGLNVLDYLNDRQLIAWCSTQGIAVTIYEPLASGLLTDVPFEQTRSRWVGGPWESLTVYPELMCPENAEAITAVLEGLRRIGDEVGATVADVAIAWLLRQPGVDAAIVGSSNPDRARVNAAAASVQLSDEALRVIDDELIPAWTSSRARASAD